MMYPECEEMIQIYFYAGDKVLQKRYREYWCPKLQGTKQENCTNQKYFYAIYVRYTSLLYKSSNGKGKGKAVPLQAWSGPEGSRKLRFPDFMTMTQDGGTVVSLMHRLPLPPGNTPGKVI